MEAEKKKYEEFVAAEKKKYEDYVAAQKKAVEDAIAKEKELTEKLGPHAYAHMVLPAHSDMGMGTLGMLVPMVGTGMATQVPMVLVLQDTHTTKHTTTIS